MEIVYFTVTAIVLYVVADWILQRMEIQAGRRFANRSLIFLAILLPLALGSFALIQHLTAP